jgi:group I intron endonuclease
MPRAFVYVIQNVKDGKIYVGKTISPNVRFGNHLTYARNGSSKGHLYKAIRKYGESSFTYNLIEEHQTESEALEAERFFIAYLRSIGARLYNLTEGGEGTSGYKRSPEQIQRGVENSRAGLKQAWVKPEVRARHSLARKKLWSDEKRRETQGTLTKLGMSDPGVKKKLVANGLAVWADPNSREKLLAANAKSESRKAKGDAASKRWKDPGNRKKYMASALNPVVLEAKRQASLRRWARYRRDNGLEPKLGDFELLTRSHLVPTSGEHSGIQDRVQSVMP